MHVQEAIIRQKKTSRRPADRSSIAGSCMGNQSLQPHQTTIGRARAGSPQRRNFPAFTALRAKNTLMKMPEPGGAVVA